MEVCVNYYLPRALGQIGVIALAGGTAQKVHQAHFDGRKREGSAVDRDGSISVWPGEALSAHEHRDQHTYHLLRRRGASRDLDAPLAVAGAALWPHPSLPDCLQRRSVALTNKKPLYNWTENAHKAHGQKRRYACSRMCVMFTLRNAEAGTAAAANKSATITFFI